MCNTMSLQDEKWVKVFSELGKSAKKEIYHICDIAYTRLPGSENEKKGQEYFKKRLEEIGADEIEINQFHVYPKFFLWWPRISTILFYIGLFFYPFIPLISVFTSLLMITNVVAKLLSYTFLDKLFRKKESLNVIGKFKPRDPEGNLNSPKKILLLGGHMDSNYEFPIGRKLGKKMGIIALISLFLMLLFLIASIVKSILLYTSTGYLIQPFSITTFRTVLNSDYFYIFFLVSLPYITWTGFWMIRNLPVAGANDNLSAIASILKVAEFIKKHPEFYPKNIELWIVSFGSEEGGMMGSKYLSNKIKKLMDEGELSVPIWVVNFDSVGSDGPLQIASSEPLYRVKSHSPEVYNALARSAEKAGIDYYIKALDAGTDSAPFSRLGIPACGVVCFGNENSPAHWHSRDDIPENIDPNGLTNVIRLSVQFLYDLDTSI